MKIFPLICMLIFSISLRVNAHPDELLSMLPDPIAERQSSASSADKSLGVPLWEIDAGVPFIGSPVHERMTKAAVTISNIYSRSFDLGKDEAFIHGVFWNDDPDDLLCPECSVLNPLKFDKRWGINFATRFYLAKKRAMNVAQDKCDLAFKVGDGLLERSHFGDLQFLHAMASCNGELAKDTQLKMLSWAEFVYKVSIGEIPQKTKMNKIPIENIKNMFLTDNRVAELTIEEFFKGGRLARRVAMGSLLHMIQDSFAPGHANRAILDYPIGSGTVFARGAIADFHCYTGQDESLHAQDDKWPGGLDEHAPIGSDNPITIGANLLIEMNKRTPWPDVEKYLKNTVFAIKDPAAISGPGEKYRKKIGESTE